MDKLESVSLALMARDFWRLVSNSCEELVKRDNPFTLVYEGLEWPNDEEWSEHTKWSDISIAQPVLFNFYHGIELSLKALLASKQIKAPTNHSLSQLYNLVKDQFTDPRIDNFYRKYVIDNELPEILSRFCNESSVSIDMYYQSLKYPTSTKGIEFKHSELRYNGKEGTEFFDDIKNNVKTFTEVLTELVANEIKIA
jgi:hypothetical protein